MRIITQKDIFIYLNRKNSRVYHTQTEVAAIINDVFGYSADKSIISNIVNGKKKGLSNLNMSKIDQFYKELFDDRIDNLNDDAMNAIFKDAKDFVIKNKLFFDNYQGTREDTFETYMKRMLTYALPNLDCEETVPNPAEKEESTSLVFHSENLAFYERDFFTGRENFLKDIQSHLDQDGLVILTGMGGIGKSALAAQFASSSRTRYPLVQVVSNEFQHTFQSVILAMRFDGRRDEKEPPKERYQRRMELLRKLDTQTLVIIDNVDEPWEDIKDFYAHQRDLKLHLIITSRLTNVFPKKICLPVPPLPVNKQREMFIHYYGEMPAKQESLMLDEILQYIEGHTLLIELIAKTMYCESLYFNEILEWLRNQKMDHGFMENGEHKNIKEVIRNMLFRSMLSDEQRQLLRQLTFLPAEGISRRLFLRSLCRSASVSLSQLEDRSWVIRERADCIRVHPVIRDAIRSDMPLTWAEHSPFLRAVQEAMKQPSDGLSEKDQISLCQLARGMWEALRTDKIPLELWDCLSSAARYCKNICQYETALHLCELLSCVEEDITDTDRRVELHLEIGSLHQRSANYKEAAENYSKALEMTRQDDDQRGSCYNSLGVIYRKDAEYEKAMAYFKKALNCFKNEQKIATAQNDLGVVYMNLGSMETDLKKACEFYQNAKTHYEESLNLREKLGAPVRDLAFSYHNIGSAYYRLGEYEKALEKHRQALQLREKHHLQKPDIAASFNWIGNDLIRLGEFEKAKEQLNRSLEIRLRILGSQHPDLAWVLISLSEYHEKMGEYSLAIQFLQEAYDIRKKCLRPGHPYTINVKQQLDELMRRVNEPILKSDVPVEIQMH